MNGKFNRRVLKGVGALGGALALVAALATSAAAVTTSTTPTPSWTPTSGTVYAVLKVGNTIVIGGDFTALRSPDNKTTVTRDRLAALDATTGALLAWNPGANDTVRSLESSADGTSVYVGGDFTTAGGASHTRIADVRLSDGSAISTFTASASGTVRALKRISNTLYAGGEFTSMNGSSRQHVAALSPTTGASVSGFSASTNNTVYTLQDSPTSGNLLVGGKFTTLDSVSHVYLGQISASTGAVTSWNPSVCPSAASSNRCYVFGIVHDTSSVYLAVGGYGGRVVALTASTGARRWTDTTDGDVQAIAIYGTTLYAGGHFDTAFAGQPRAGLVEITSSTGAVVSGFAPRIGHGLGVFAIQADATALRIGGGFDHVDDTTEMRYTVFQQS